jgi:hypothetical protein
MAVVQIVTRELDGTETVTEVEVDDLHSEEVTGMDPLLPEQPAPIDPVLVAAETIQTEIDVRLAPSSVNSIAEVKTAIRYGLAAAVDILRGNT